MKKIIVAVAIVCAAALSQAATANWGVGASNIYAGKGDTTKVAKGVTVYMFDAGITTQAALFELFAADTAMDFTKATGYAGSVATTAAGVMAQTQAAAKFSYGSQSTAEKTNAYDFYFAIVDGDNIYLSATKNVEANGTDTAVTVGFGSQGTGAQALPKEGFQGVGAWSTAAVPEPTSGLLLLLGMAGLALRRKQK